MRSARSMLWIGIALSVLAPPAFAEDIIILNDGTIHRGTIVSVEEDGIRVKSTPKGGGTLTIKLPAHRLDPHFFYDLRVNAAGDDAQEHLELALWAIENGLFARAKAQITRAAELDPKLVAGIQEGHLHKIREGIARRVLESAKRDVATGRLDRAERKVEGLLARMPDTEAGAEAADYIHEVQRAVAKAAVKTEEQRVAALAQEEREAEAARLALLAPVDRDLQSTMRLMTEGLTADDEKTAFTKLERALTSGHKALAKLDELTAKHGDVVPFMEAIEWRRRRAIDTMVRVHIQRADIYNQRSSRPQARKEIEEARALDPGNHDIAQAEQRIEDAEEQDALDLRWQRARRPGTGRFGGRR